MKKFLSLMLAVLMLLSMATVAFADGETSTTYKTVANGGSFDLKKNYVGSAYAPKETFEFETQNGNNPTADGFTDGITVTHTLPEDTSTTTGSYGTITVKLPTYKRVGTYTYEITEKGSTNYGVKKDDTKYTLTVLVLNDSNEETGFTCRVFMKNSANAKVDSFNNEYEYGVLDVSKVVTSNFVSNSNEKNEAEENTEYNFTISFDKINNNLKGKYYTLNGGTKEYDSQEPTVTDGMSITLTNGKHFEIVGLPVGATYTVRETSSLNKKQYHNGTVSTTYNPDSTTTVNEESVHCSSGSISKNQTSSVVVTNDYNYNGQLIVKKNISGDFVDLQTANFTFTVTFTGGAPTGTTNAGTANNGSYTFTLKNGEEAVFTGIPYGTTYTVTEAEVEGYQSSYKFGEFNNTITSEYDVSSESAVTGTSKSNEKMNNATEKIEFTNVSTAEIPTGVSLDTLPYVLVLALAGAGLVLMIARKRRVQD